MSVLIVKWSDQQRVIDLLILYYSAPERPGPPEVAGEAHRRLAHTWEDDCEPPPSRQLDLAISLPKEGWIAIAYPMDLTFDAPLAAWLARVLDTEAYAAYTWGSMGGDGYGLLTFDARGFQSAEGHIRDERSDKHLCESLESLSVPFHGDEDHPIAAFMDGSVVDRHVGWQKVSIPPRPWPPLPHLG